MKKGMTLLLAACLLLGAIALMGGCSRAPQEEDIYDRVVELAQAEGVEVRESEIIGLVPQDAVIGVDSARIRLNCDLNDKILENNIPPEWLTEE